MDQPEILENFYCCENRDDELQKDGKSHERLDETIVADLAEVIARTPQDVVEGEVVLRFDCFSTDPAKLGRTFEAVHHVASFRLFNRNSAIWTIYDHMR